MVQSTFLRSFEFSDNTVSGYKCPYVILCPFNTPSVPLAVRKTLGIVFLTHVSSFQKFLLCHTGSKQKWYLIPILSDTKRTSSRSLRKRVQLHPFYRRLQKSSYALIKLSVLELKYVCSKHRKSEQELGALSLHSKSNIIWCLLGMFPS